MITKKGKFTGYSIKTDTEEVDEVYSYGIYKEELQDKSGYFLLRWDDTFWTIINWVLE